MTPCPANRHRGGFSLLEVMAAVAILGIWYITLSGSAMSGVRAQGVSQHRMHASLIADLTLADLEAMTLDGGAPEVVSDEYVYEQDDRFTIVTEVWGWGDAEGGRAIEPEPLPDDSVAGGDDLMAFLEAEMPAMLEYLRVIQVEVSWQDGDRRIRVLRTTYAYDGDGAREAFGAANPNAQQAADPSGLGGGGQLGGGQGNGLGRSGLGGGRK